MNLQIITVVAIFSYISSFGQATKLRHSSVLRYATSKSDLIPIFTISKSQLLKFAGEETFHDLSIPYFRVKRSIARHERRKRRRLLTVDCLLLVDHSVYDHFFHLSRNDSYSAESAIGQYFLRIIQETNRIYMHLPFESIRIRIRPAGIIISKKFSDSKWIKSESELEAFEEKQSIDILNANMNKTDDLDTNMTFYDNATLNNRIQSENEKSPSYLFESVNRDSYTLLKRLSKWVLDNHQNLPINDHVIAFTREDLRRSGDHLAQGIAYVKSMCKRGESVSLVEDIGAMGSVAVVAHEIAHSLGADHDGTELNKDCPYEHNFLMGPSVSGSKELNRNTMRFSNCTLNQISEYLETHKQSTSCLNRATFNSFSVSRRKREIPGQVYDATKQCQLTFDDKFKFCGDQEYYLNQLCHRLWCRNVSQSRFAPCYTKHYLPAFYGTSCGHKMWCVNGACVEDSRAPASNECKFGDRDKMFCVKLITTSHNTCNSTTFKRFCCKTCRNLKRYKMVF